MIGLRCRRSRRGAVLGEASRPPPNFQAQPKKRAKRGSAELTGPDQPARFHLRSDRLASAPKVAGAITVVPTRWQRADGRRIWKKPANNTQVRGLRRGKCRSALRSDATRIPRMEIVLREVSIRTYAKYAGILRQALGTPPLPTLRDVAVGARKTAVCVPFAQALQMRQEDFSTIVSGIFAAPCESGLVDRGKDSHRWDEVGFLMRRSIVQMLVSS